MWLELVLFFLVVLLLHHYITTPRGLPPGPFVIPYLGSKFILKMTEVREARKKYGDIFKSELFGIRTVFLCNYKLIKEAFTRSEMANRPNEGPVHFLTDGVEAGVIMTNGKQWQNARRFLLRNLKDLGMGKTYLEHAIQKEVKFLVDDMRKVAGKSTPVPNSIKVVVLNVVWQMVASKRYDLDDEDVMRFVNILRANESNVLIIFSFIFPRLAALLPQYIRKNWFNEDFILDLKEQNLKLCKELIESHRAALDPDNPRDIIDEYLLEMDAKTDIATYFSEVDLSRIIFDMFIAGFDTVSNTLQWFILYMAKYPEVQRRVQEQIDEVVPRDTLPSYEHKPKLPLVEALIHEVLRKSSIAPMGVHHAPNTDVHFDGYLIPKRTMILGVIACCHEDPQYWEAPEEFKLEHFLDADGNFVSKKEGFLPFGVGRRSCLGESLARMELYIFISALLQNFTFSPPEGCEVDLDPCTKQPTFNYIKDQNIFITERK